MTKPFHWHTELDVLRRLMRPLADMPRTPQPREWPSSAAPLDLLSTLPRPVPASRLQQLQ